LGGFAAIGASYMKQNRDMTDAPTPEDDAPSDQLKRNAQRALEERPTLSVRVLVSLVFGLWFFLSLLITITSIVLVTNIEKKILFTESAAKYIFEVQQARRFEKNYFLYGTNLNDSLEQVRLSRNILEKNSDMMLAVVGKRSFDAMRHHINRYEKLLLKLQDRGKKKLKEPDANLSEIEDDLRKHGEEMVAAAENLLARERQAVNSMIYLYKRGPMLFLLFLLILMIFCANFLARQMIRPLKELMDATHRIANGDITTPILPVRRYRDEFTELSIAMNSMMQELSQNQEQLIKAHKLKAVGTLTAGIAHELNNPINNIMLTAYMLEEDFAEIDDAERLDMIHDLVEQAGRSQKIIRNLLEFAREREIDNLLYQLNDMLEKTIQLVANQLKLANVTVERRFTANLEPVSGDEQQLTQVFLNLILNAIDAMPGGGTLIIETNTVKEGGYLKVDFIDSGSGIPDHIKLHIFDPFFTTKAQGKGTGLGLSVSQGIVRKHGGDILVKSQMNSGSTFTVLLPIAKIPAQIT
jgi:signal transduction histidine kinase